MPRLRGTQGSAQESPPDLQREALRQEYKKTLDLPTYRLQLKGVSRKLSMAGDREASDYRWFVYNRDVCAETFEEFRECLEKCEKVIEEDYDSADDYSYGSLKQDLNDEPEIILARDRVDQSRKERLKRQEQRLQYEQARDERIHNWIVTSVNCIQDEMSPGTGAALRDSII